MTDPAIWDPRVHEIVTRKTRTVIVTNIDIKTENTHDHRGSQSIT